MRYGPRFAYSAYRGLDENTKKAIEVAVLWAVKDICSDITSEKITELMQASGNPQMQALINKVTEKAFEQIENVTRGVEEEEYAKEVAINAAKNLEGLEKKSTDA